MSQGVKLVGGALIAFVVATPASSLAITFTTLDFDPSGVHRTYAYGISGSNIVGNYKTNRGDQGFLYNGASYVTVAPPFLDSTYDHSYAFGVSGNNVVGYYQDAFNQNRAFLYDGSSYTTLLDAPNARNGGAFGTQALGIAGTNVVGRYFDASTMHGYLYDGSSYLTIDHPSAAVSLTSGGTAGLGIFGNNVVGYYLDTSRKFHGFLYDGSSFTTIDHPLASTALFSGTVATGIYGTNIVGYYDRFGIQHGFIFDGSTFTTIDHPLGSNGTRINGIWDNVIVGYYTDSQATTRNFTAEIPEPSLFALLGTGAVVLGVVSRRKMAKTFFTLLKRRTALKKTPLLA